SSSYGLYSELAESCTAAAPRAINRAFRRFWLLPAAPRAEVDCAPRSTVHRVDLV
ncbi:hypothetical protein A2U01_0102436, partial [Trifolium medium]|nr:hypothetical protein [Trifolium medium]